MLKKSSPGYEHVKFLKKCYVKMFIFSQERWSVQHRNSSPNGSPILSAEIYLPLSDGKRNVRQRRVRIFWWRGPPQWKLRYWETPTGDWKYKGPAPNVLLLFPAAYRVNKMCLLVWFNWTVLLLFVDFFFPLLHYCYWLSAQFTLFFWIFLHRIWQWKWLTPFLSLS